MTPRHASPFLPCIVLLQAMACNFGPASDPPEQPAVLVVGVEHDLGSLNPILYETSLDGDIVQNVQFSLHDAQFRCGLEFEPMLVERWSWSDDGRDLTYHLRSDIHWSDGRPVTAADVKWSYELAHDPKTASPRIGLLEHMVDGFNPRVVDEHTLLFRFDSPRDRTTLHAHAASLSPLPRHAMRQVDRSELQADAQNLLPLVTGPFRLGSRVAGHRFELLANEQFTGPHEFQPKLDRVVFRVLPEYATRLLALTRGEIHMMSGIDVSDVASLRQHPEITLHRRGWRFIDFVAWNQQRPLFADAAVRRALAMSVDVDEMMTSLLTDDTGRLYGRKATSTISPEHCLAHNDDVEPVPHDVAKARELMAGAGWSDSNGDGWLDRNGDRFEFTLSTNQGNALRSKLQVLLQAELKKIGVKVNLERLESNAFFSDVLGREYDAAILGWEAAMFVDPSLLWSAGTETQPNRMNFTSYADPRVDALIQRGLAIREPKEAAPIWHEVQQAIYDDQPYLFLWWRDEIVGLHTSVQNAEVNFSSRLHRLWEWDLAASAAPVP